MVFTVVVTHVLRGPQVNRVEVDNLASGGCSRNIVARVGDRIALALDATAFDGSTAANGAAWIVGRPPDGYDMTTVEAVFDLAGVPLPDPSVVAPEPSRTPGWLGAAITGIGVGLVFLVAVLVLPREESR
jgi:hypothetical protein